MVAFSASRLVWLAIEEISPTTSPIRAEAVRRAPARLDGAVGLGDRALRERRGAAHLPADLLDGERRVPRRRRTTVATFPAACSAAAATAVDWLAVSVACPPWRGPWPAVRFAEAASPPTMPPTAASNPSASAIVARVVPRPRLVCEAAQLGLLGGRAGDQRLDVLHGAADRPDLVAAAGLRGLDSVSPDPSAARAAVSRRIGAVIQRPRPRPPRGDRRPSRSRQQHGHGAGGIGPDGEAVRAPADRRLDFVAEGERGKRTGRGGSDRTSRATAPAPPRWRLRWPRSRT